MVQRPARIAVGGNAGLGQQGLRARRQFRRTGRGVLQRVELGREAAEVMPRDLLVAAKANWVSMEYGAIDRMKAGDFQASTTWNGAGLRIRLARPEVHFGYPKEGFTYWSDNVVVLKDAKNVENAKLFQNFIMDPEVAAGLSAFHRYANGIAGSDKYMPADMKDAPEVVIPADVKPLGELQRLCSPETQDLYTKIWTELRK